MAQKDKQPCTPWLAERSRLLPASFPSGPPSSPQQAVLSVSSCIGTGPPSHTVQHAAEPRGFSGSLPVRPRDKEK